MLNNIEIDIDMLHMWVPTLISEVILTLNVGMVDDIQIVSRMTYKRMRVQMRRRMRMTMNMKVSASMRNWMLIIMRSTWYLSSGACFT